MCKLQRDGGARVGRSPGLEDAKGRLCHRGAVLRRQKGAPGERVGDNRDGKGAQKPREDKLLLRTQDIRRKRAAILRATGTRREDTRTTKGIRPKRTELREIPKRRNRGV